jgi:hypothetical protein
MSAVSLDSIAGTTTTLDTDFIVDTKFNQVEYEVEIWLDNSGGNSINQRVPLNPNSIVNLTINDTLANWAAQGTITVMHSPESAPANQSSDYGQSILTPRGNYVFRNDGLDLLRIRMIPKTNPSNNKSYSSQSDRKFWTLSFLFSIYDREEIDLPQGSRNAAGSTIKALKLYFWDCWYQRLNTRVVQYSTGLSTKSTVDPTLDNGTQGVLKTGEAIKEIIDLGLSESGKQGSLGGYMDPSIGSGFGFNYPPTVNIGPDFDIGAANIFYTAPAFATAYDSLMYMYSKHVSSEFIPSSPAGPQPPRGGRPFSNKVFDFCLLKKEKGPNETDIGQLSLKPISKIFEKAGNTQTGPGQYQIEHFFVQGYGADSANKAYRAPKGDNSSNNIDITSPGYSYIQNYRFVDIAAATNAQDFCNRPVYSFDYKNRVLNIEYDNNSVTTARKFMSDRYIKQLYKSGSGDEIFLINLEEEKKDLNFKPTFSNDGDNPDIRQSIGLQKLLKIGVFQNACINFRTLGLPFRESGRFIAIDKIDGVESGEFEDKFYGQWFIIDIKHIFESEIYYNDITAIKMHRFAASSVNLYGTL